jgi:hypothetical protein
VPENSVTQRSTHFEFQHAVFRAPDARFLLASDGAPAMVVRLGDMDAVIPLKSLRNEFDLDDTPDADLLEKVAAGLRYVKVIRPGDSIPREILDGTASWSVEDRHLEIARGRITVQISSWLVGQETVITDQETLLKLAEDPGVKTRVNEAFGEIARKLGLAADRRQEVVDRIDHVARELSYIEALRDRFATVQGVRTKVLQFHKIYRRDRSIFEELMRIDNLIRRPLDELRDIFDQVDAQCGEILSLLRNLDRQIAFIRESRDELHTRMMLWDDTITAWEAITIERSPENEQAIREIYRFCARNFMIEKPWQLTGAASIRQGNRP